MRLYSSILLTIAVIVLVAAFIFGYRLMENASPIKHLDRGARNYDTKKYEDAINDLNEYLVLEPNSINTSKANYLIASSLKELNNTRLAKEKFVDVINNPNSGEYLIDSIIEYANICRLQNEISQFIQPYLSRYLDYPNDKSVQYEMNMLYGYQKFFEKKYDEAIGYFLRSNGELATLGLARIYFEKNNYEKAFDLYEEFIKYYPSSIYYSEIVRTYTIQVSAYAYKLYETKDYSLSRYYYAKLAVLFPRTKTAEKSLFRIAQSYYIERDYTQAVEYYKKVRVNNVDLLDAEALLYIGIANFKMNNWEISYKYLNSFVTEYAGNANVAHAKTYMSEIEKLYLIQ